MSQNPSPYIKIPRIKICGLTRPEDAVCALEAGVDAIGLVFYTRSPRAVTIEQAQAITQAVGPFVSIVGLFVNASVEEVNSVLKAVPISVLQFHGEEPAEFCAQFQRPWMKAIRMKPGLDLPSALKPYHSASAILLDAYKEGVQGGTGEKFDWAAASPDKLPVNFDTPIVLAGGLNVDNVAEAIACVQPYGVDVSGGVENSPGIKNPQKIINFVKAIN